MKILVTGSAGFIGHALSLRLLARGDEVIGIDNLNDYYDVKLKRARLSQLLDHKNFSNLQFDLEDAEALSELFRHHQPQRVVNLAAQAGVRHSLQYPQTYISSNLAGFVNILEECRHNKIEHLVYASSSSVYGANTRMPFSVHHNTDHPVSLYAATKKANELFAHTYSHLFRLPTTGLRFFTVYGPWGRPDMALFMFTRAILAGKTIDIFNNGQHKRDFTYIDDIIDGVIRALDKVADVNSEWDSTNPDPASSDAPYRIYNIGNNNPIELMHFINTLEKCLGESANKNFLPMQAGDVPTTYADIDTSITELDYQPTTKIEDGIARFVEWYKDYYEM